jgi:hypothetical protein
LVDGFAFKKIKNDFDLINYLNLIFTLNVDGMVTSKNKKCSIYPFFLSCNNIPKNLRKKSIFNFMFALYNKKKEIDVPYDPIIQLLTEELNILKNGIIINNYKVKGFLINVLADLPVRGKLLKMKLFNGTGSCNFCMINGVIIEKFVKFPICETEGKTKKKKN